MGVAVTRGDPRDDRPGQAIVIPDHPARVRVVDVDLARIRRSYLRNALAALPARQALGAADLEYLAAETRSSPSQVQEVAHEVRGTTG